MKIVLLEPIGASENKINEFKSKLKKLGHKIIVFSNKPLTETEIIKRAFDADILILSNLPLKSRVISQCKNLKMISVAFTGFNHIETHVCKRRKILVCNAAGYSTNSVAELTYGLIFSILRRLKICDVVTRKKGTRKRLIGNELNGKTLGIIGTGSIGLRVAEIGKVFGCTLLGFSRSKRIEAKSLGIKYVTLRNLLKSSDIISLHTPLNKSTKNLLSWREFRLMKPSAIVIQVSRGGIINEKAFAYALNNEKIAGAGIDVFMQEPPLDIQSPLLTAKNTLVTPHIGFATIEALDTRTDIVFSNILKYLKGNIQNRVV